MQKRTSSGRAFQENLLDRLAETNQITTIYLRNRMSLRGRIREFDPYVLLLEPLDGSPATLVYKSAIVSISGPARRPGPPPRRMPPRPGGPRPPHQFAPPRGPAPFQRPEGGFQRPEGGYNRPEGGYNRPEGGFQRPDGGFNRPRPEESPPESSSDE